MSDTTPRPETDRPARPSYEAPRIVWEEPFIPETFSACGQKNASCLRRAGGIRT